MMRDFFTILEAEGIYNVANHNKSEATYVLFGNLVESISIDQPQKAPRAERDILFATMRPTSPTPKIGGSPCPTTGRILIDYNPPTNFTGSTTRSFQGGRRLFQTTYLDNPHLGMRWLQKSSAPRCRPRLLEGLWIGREGQSRATILTHWKEFDQIPTDYKSSNIGLTSAYTNDPTAIVKVHTDGHGLILDEVLRHGIDQRGHFANPARRRGGAGHHDHCRQRRAQEHRRNSRARIQRPPSPQGARQHPSGV